MVLKQLNVYMEGGGRRRKGWGCGQVRGGALCPCEQFLGSEGV